MVVMVVTVWCVGFVWDFRGWREKCYSWWFLQRVPRLDWFRWCLQKRSEKYDLGMFGAGFFPQFLTHITCHPSTSWSKINQLRTLPDLINAKTPGVLLKLLVDPLPGDSVTFCCSWNLKFRANPEMLYDFRGFYYVSYTLYFYFDLVSWLGKRNQSELHQPWIGLLQKRFPGILSWIQWLIIQLETAEETKEASGSTSCYKSSCSNSGCIAIRINGGKKICIFFGCLHFLMRLANDAACLLQGQGKVNRIPINEGMCCNLTAKNLKITYKYHTSRIE